MQRRAGHAPAATAPPSARNDAAAAALAAATALPRPWRPRSPRHLAAALLLLLHTSLLLATAPRPAAAQQQPQQPGGAAGSLCSAAGAFPVADRPSGMSRGGNMLKVYHNLYLHNGNWFALLGPGSNASEVDAGMSLNFGVVALPTADVAAFQANLKKVRRALQLALVAHAACWVAP
jgi:hypothetical protein